MLPRLAVRPGRQARAHGVAEALREFHADVIVFQEAFLPAAREIILKGLKHIYPHHYGPGNNNFHIKSSSGVWVLSKLPLQLLKTIRFTHNTGFDAMVRKGAMLLQGTHLDQTFQIVGSHMQAGVTAVEPREKQIEDLYTKLLKPFEQKGVPQFICGDLNVGIDTPHHDTLLKNLDATNGEITGPVKFSYDGFTNTLARSLGYKDKYTTYDYILLRQNNAPIKNMHRHIKVFRAGEKDLSDHYAVVAEVDWG